MKKLIYSAIIAGAIFSYAACKKCTTCTYTEGNGTVLTDSSFCGKGKVYKDQLEQHEKNGWICIEE
ncbi:MAG: hypothetical protein COA57_01920 [Flavobacteriales bacterium]|nr:MAG: hypothetical protein COA57_01920 [Flavobacteriales bacterium]